MPSKVLERIFYDQLIYYFESYGLLFSNQHGLRKCKSTTTAIMEFIQFLYEKYDRRLDTSCVYVDYSRAFDTLNHEILCKKLKLYGLDQNSLNWCIDYLSDRGQQVKLGPLQVEMGVPQGSIIGPLLFIVYINDLVSKFGREHSEITLYADDTILYSAGETIMQASDVNQTSVNILYDWCNLNRLSINKM